jgi:hypothetical protein
MITGFSFLSLNVFESMMNRHKFESITESNISSAQNTGSRRLMVERSKQKSHETLDKRDAMSGQIFGQVAFKWRLIFESVSV